MMFLLSAIAFLFVVFMAYPIPCESLKRSIQKRTVTERPLLSCYDCSAHNSDCGIDESTIVKGCRACLVYQNIFDGNNVIRRCCTSGCGESNTIADFEGRTAYFCESDLCNGIGSENALTGTGASTASTSPAVSSTITTTSSTTVTTTFIEPLFSCYDCSAHNPECGVNEATVVKNCRACLIYQNIFDNNNILRRCCTSGCAAPNTVGEYDGRIAYFCGSDLCNGQGLDQVFTGVTDSTSSMSSTISSTQTTTSLSTTTITTITTTTPTTTFTTTATTTPTTTSVQTSFTCYDCSGPNCGQEGSPVSSDCPSCMVYRNPDDQTNFVRRCCWWDCGMPNTIKIHSGLETFFCTSDKCNGYGAELTLSPPATTTTTTVSTTTTSTSTTTTSTSTTTTVPTTTTSCVLNCQNGGTPETENGCFCYCLDNTNGRECENIDCTQSDLDAEVCAPENEPLCTVEENFAFSCLHLCQKC